MTQPSHVAELLHRARRLVRNRVRRYERAGLPTRKLRSRNQARDILLEAIMYESPWWNHDLLRGLAHCLDRCVDPPEYPMILMEAAVVSLDCQTRLIVRDRERFRALYGNDWLVRRERELRDTANRIKKWPLGDCSAILAWLRFFSVLYRFDSGYAKEFQRVTRFWTRITKAKSKPRARPGPQAASPQTGRATRTARKTR